MEDVRRGGAETHPQRSLEALGILLDAGIDPHQGRFAPKTSKDPDARRKYYGVVEGRGGGEVASRLWGAVPFRGYPEAFNTNWMAKVIWAARNSPALPQMVQLFLDKGVHPHDQGARRFLKGECLEFDSGKHQDIKRHPWSSWPTALASGRMDVLELLAQNAGDERPPDLAPAVWAALMAGVNNPSRLEGITQSLSWFLDRYPPRPDERASIMRTMFEDGRIRSPDMLAFWLALPQSTLHDPNGPLEAGEGFNPWSCIEQSNRLFDPYKHRLVKTLLTHPKWGRAQALLSAPWPRFGDLSRDPEMERSTILASWIDASRLSMVSRPASSSDCAVERLFKHLDALEGVEDQSLPRVFAWMREAPGPEASAWLKRNPNAWLKEKTPWHYGPRLSIMTWLKGMEISPWATDAQGVSGIGGGLVERLKDWDVQLAESFVSNARPLLESERMDWGEPVEGFSLAQWAHGSSPACRLSPLKGWDAGAFSVAVLLGDEKRFDYLLEQWKKEGSPGLSLKEAAKLMEAWAHGSSRFKVLPNNTVWREEDAHFRGKLIGVIAPMLGPGMLARLAPLGKDWLWERVQGMNGPGVSERPDLIGLWDLYQKGGLELGPKDRWALAWWAQDICSEGFGGMPVGSLGLSASPLWKKLPDEERAWVARATLVLARKKKEGMDSFWIESFLREFQDVDNLLLGASPGRALKVLKFLEHDARKIYEKEGLACPPSLGRWAACARAHHMEEVMAPVPPSAVRPGRGRRF